MNASGSGLLARLGALVQRELGAPLQLTLAAPVRADRCPPPRAEGVSLVLAHALRPSPHAHLWLDAGLALDLIDRTLGGEGVQIPAAHPAARPSDAELGVLAYAVASALQAIAPGMQLVSLEATAPPSEDADVAVWQAYVRLGGVDGSARYAHGPALFPSGPLRARWVLAAEALAREAGEPAPGDVVHLERAVRPAESWLHLPDLGALLPVRVDGDVLHPGTHAAPDPGHARLELSLADWPLDRLLSLGAGEAPRLELDEDATAFLHRGGSPPCQGALVRLDGKLGVRVTGGA